MIEGPSCRFKTLPAGQKLFLAASGCPKAFVRVYNLTGLSSSLRGMSLWNSSRARPPVPLFAHSSTSQLINTVVPLNPWNHECSCMSSQEKFDDLQVVGYR
eukprot:767312-Hanusia_phi.AAC.2